jgi:hypothetical protein
VPGAQVLLWGGQCERYDVHTAIMEV